MTGCDLSAAEFDEAERAVRRRGPAPNVTDAELEAHLAELYAAGVRSAYGMLEACRGTRFGTSPRRFYRIARPVIERLGGSVRKNAKGTVVPDREGLETLLAMARVELEQADRLVAGHVAAIRERQQQAQAAREMRRQRQRRVFRLERRLEGLS